MNIPNHRPSFVVEIAQDDMDSLVLLPEQILDRDLDVIKSDIGSARGRGVRCLDGLGLDAFTTLDEEHTKALASVDAGNEIVAEDTVGDPLLGSVDDLKSRKHASKRTGLPGKGAPYVVLAVGGLNSSRP